MRKNKYFPLLEKAKKGLNSFSYEPFSKYFLNENLKHNLRPYQLDALYSLDWQEKREIQNPIYKHNLLMFNMATGSGKTDVMAACILYFYATQGYTDFLFVSGSNAIVNKTNDNFLHSYSEKYLFADPIEINGQRIEVKSVEGGFPDVEEHGVIYLKTITVQALTNYIDSNVLNQITLNNLQNRKLIILADEAHHFNANTKKRGTSKKQNIASWEHTLDLVRNANESNKQLEFTATINTDKKAVYEKYKDKILFKYSQNEFMLQGYSKKATRIAANSDNMDKLLDGVLLSQYRKRFAKSLGIPDFKPVILVKSNRIKISKEIEQQFLDMMENLSSKSLEEFIQQQRQNSRSEILNMTYSYWLKQDLPQATIELKQNFCKQTTINANDSSSSEFLADKNGSDYQKLNTLEDADNPFRIIFAVAKLTEGWDVLNLYDIVRMSEKEERISATYTDAEAQLIGRGIRYYPFLYRGKRSYQRRFDHDERKKQLLLETLAYHTINDVKYISNLNKSFDKLDLIVHDDNQSKTFTAKVKRSFKKTDLYRNGSLYYNEVKLVDNSSYKNIGDYGIDINKPMLISYNPMAIESRLRQDYEKQNMKEVTVADFANWKYYRLIKKAVAQNKDYRFNTLCRYLPNVKSMKQFLFNSQWLGKLVVKAQVPMNYTGEISAQDRLSFLVRALTQIKIKIVNSFHKQYGTNIFKAMPVSDVVKDYTKNFTPVCNTIDGMLNENITSQPMTNKCDDWFPYDFAIADGLELQLVGKMSGWIADLKKQYRTNVYLIRNEETATTLALHEFGNNTIKHYAKFMPDFILILGNGQIMYQIYIEAKGEHLLVRDAWKEQLLENIRPKNIQIIPVNRHIKLYGIRFYIKDDGNNIFKELQSLNIFPN